MIKNYWGLVIVLMLSFWTIKPLFIPGFFPMHDDTQVARVFEMAKSLKDGLFPVRWVNDLGYGYGYPIFNYYAPFAYYVGAKYVLLGFNALVATKISIGLAMIFAGISMYFFVRSFAKEFGGIIAAGFYMFATYHAVDLYVRGDIAELWAYAWIPLVFLSFYKRTWIFTIVGAISYAGVILSHNLTALMVTPFLLLFGLVILFKTNDKIHTLYYLVLTTMTGILLSAFYWVPAIGEMKYTNVLSQIGGGADFRNHFVCIQQFWYSPWGYGGSAPGCGDGISFALGKISFLFIFLGVISLFIALKKHTKEVGLIIFGLVGLIISLFLQTEYAKGIWETVPFMAFFQYPWRFLLTSSFFIAILSGLSIQSFWYINKKITCGFVGLVIVLLFITQVKLFTPQTILPISSRDYTNKQTVVFKTSRISDEYMPKNFLKPKNESETVTQNVSIPSSIGSVISLREKTQEKIAIIDIISTKKFVLPLAPFPAWKIFIDNKEIPYTNSAKGLLVSMPVGKHMLDIKFTQTPLEQLANVLSMAGIAILILGIIVERRHIHEPTTT